MKTHVLDINGHLNTK